MRHVPFTVGETIHDVDALKILSVFMDAPYPPRCMSELPLHYRPFGLANGVCDSRKEVHTSSVTDNVTAVPFCDTHSPLECSRACGTERGGASK